MVDRRAFIGAVASGFLGAPLAVHAQSAQRLYRIGFLRVRAVPLPKSFWDSMRGLGWVEGQNVKIEPRIASQRDQLPALAADLVQLKVDLIMTAGTPATTAAKRATATIPIVFTVADDPVQNGLVSSLARPGGNLTGTVDGTYHEKLLQVLAEARPGIARVAYPFFGEPDARFSRAAQALGIQVQGIALKGPDEFDPFFAEARKGRADAAVIPDIRGMVGFMEHIGAETLKNRLPAIGFTQSFAEAGGLLYYGPTYDYEGPIIAAQIDKIFKGAKPADLPVEQPTTFDFVINLKTAKALGIAIPQSMLLRATMVIQ